MVLIVGENGVATAPGNPTSDTPAWLSASDRLVPWFSIAQRSSSATIVLSNTCCLPLRIDSHRALLVLALLVPNRQRREARLMANQVDLERIDYLDVRDRRIGDRHAAQLGRKVDNSRRSRSAAALRLRADNAVRLNRTRVQFAATQTDRRIDPIPLVRQRCRSRLTRRRRRWLRRKRPDDRRSKIKARVTDRQPEALQLARALPLTAQARWTMRPPRFPSWSCVRSRRSR